MLGYMDFDLTRASPAQRTNFLTLHFLLLHQLGSSLDTGFWLDWRQPATHITNFVPCSSVFSSFLEIMLCSMDLNSTSAGQPHTNVLTLQFLLLHQIGSALEAVLHEGQQVMPALLGEAVLQVLQKLDVFFPRERLAEQPLKLFPQRHHQELEVNRLEPASGSVIIRAWKWMSWLCIVTAHQDCFFPSSITSSGISDQLVWTSKCLSHYQTLKVKCTFVDHEFYLNHFNPVITDVFSFKK